MKYVLCLALSFGFLTANAQTIPDSATLFECFLKKPGSRFKEMPELCRALFERETKDKGTLSLRKQVLFVLDEGFSPVNDVELRHLSRFSADSNVIYVQGQVKMARDLPGIPYGEELIIKFDGFLTGFGRSPRFHLGKPKLIRSNEMKK